MARIKSEICQCDCKMKRLYTREEGGKGWDPVGWMCDCGCICMDEGKWTVIDCNKNDCCKDDASCCDNGETCCCSGDKSCCDGNEACC